MRPHRFSAGCTLALVVALGTSACDDSILPAAIYTNAVDTVSLFAIDGTPVASHSGYSIADLSSVRTDQRGFDFVFNIDTLGRPVLIAASVFGIPGGAGLQETPSTFAALRSAPEGEYNIDSAVVVVTGDVVAVRSRVVICGIGNLFYYAKLGVIAIDPGQRRITFEILSNINCGYRSLEPGRPTQ